MVAHLTGGQGVAGSNPVSPTTKSLLDWHVQATNDNDGTTSGPTLGPTRGNPRPHEHPRRTRSTPRQRAQAQKGPHAEAVGGGRTTDSNHASPRAQRANQHERSNRTTTDNPRTLDTNTHATRNIGTLFSIRVAYSRPPFCKKPPGVSEREQVERITSKAGLHEHEVVNALVYSDWNVLFS